jgi:hypothetical protein
LEIKAILEQVLRIIMPEEIVKNFQFKELKETKDTIELYMVENEESIPKSLEDKEVVLDGFCNPIELQSFPQKGKTFYIKVIRRRWKEKGSTVSYSNDYELHYEGMKATKEFGDFLKESFGLTAAEFSERRKRLMR